MFILNFIFLINLKFNQFFNLKSQSQNPFFAKDHLKTLFLKRIAENINYFNSVFVQVQIL